MQLLCFSINSLFYHEVRDNSRSLSIHSATFQNTAMLIFTVVRISDFILFVVGQYRHKEGRIYQRSSNKSLSSYVHLLSPGTFLFHQRDRSTGILMIVILPAAFYTRLGWKRKEARSRWRYVTECNHHFPSRESSFLTACHYKSRLPVDFSNAFTPREIRTHAYTEASRWRLEGEYSED